MAISGGNGCPKQTAGANAELAGASRPAQGCLAAHDGCTRWSWPLLLLGAAAHQGALMLSRNKAEMGQVEGGWTGFQANFLRKHH